ncbi:MFS transporter [Rhodococcus sp. D2-41]|uniref:MFS transporter n=1 Tax=Speluncibacter jeojiensis TaxID=2710754 RepID=UPI00240EFF69|nr:MFS transporter [Rhodococcus sp. D2-41]MDG3009623.1 MFS transporter [Rhodococcus sp. D2-41]
MSTRTARSVTHADRTAVGVGIVALLGPLMLIELFSGIFQVYFAPLYPALAHKFSVDIATLSWALIVFTLSGALSTPVFAKLGDVYGHRRILKVELGLVTLGTVLIAVAPTFPLLLAGRFLQGMFAAFLPLMFGIVRSRTDVGTTTRAVAYLSAVLLFGTLLGSIASTLLLRASSGMTWLLWLPVAGLAVGLASLWLGPGEPANAGASANIDLPGLLLLGVGLASLLLGLSQGPKWGWGSARILVALAAGVVALAVWVVVELNVAEPLADLRFLFRRNVVPVYVVGVGVYFGSIGGQVSSATFMALPGHRLGYGLGLSASEISTMFIPILVVASLAAVLTGRLGRVLGFSWVMVLGGLCAALGTGGLIFFHHSVPTYLAFAVVGGAGMGFIEGSTRAVIVGALRRGEVAMGQSIYELATVIGGALGGAVLGAILSAHLVHGAIPSERGFEIVWSTTAALAVVATIAALVHALRGGDKGAPAR